MKRRVIGEKTPFVRNHLQVDMTAAESQRFDDAVAKAGVFKARTVRNLIIEWSNKILETTK